MNTVDPVSVCAYTRLSGLTSWHEPVKPAILFPGKRGLENAMSQSDDYDHEILLQFDSAFPTRTEVQQIQEIYPDYHVQAVDAEEL